MKPPSGLGLRSRGGRVVIIAWVSARHVTGSDSCVALLWAPTQHVQSISARPEISPASVSSSLWSPVAGQLRTGTIPATDHRHGTLKDCTTAVHADAPPAEIRESLGWVSARGSVIFQGRQSPKDLHPATNCTNREATKATRVAHMSTEEIGDRCQVEPGLVRKRTKPENNPDERGPYSNDLV